MPFGMKVNTRNALAHRSGQGHDIVQEPMRSKQTTLVAIACGVGFHSVQ